MSDLDTDAALAHACGRNAGTEDSIDGRLAMLAVGDALGVTLGAATLGRYAIGKSLGRGGQGCVYEGFDPVLDRAVALKLARFRCGDGGDALKLEARALAQIAHPNVVAVYALEVFDARPVVVMERVYGMPLVEWITMHAPALPVIVEAIACVADGLAAIHERGITHRDVKPANILVDAAGVPRLVDLGLAAAEGKHGVGLGTPAFAAPEQLAGNSEPASDQYGLGATMRAALRAWQHGDERRVLPPRLAAIAARAMSPSPKDRFTSAAAMAVALRRRPRHRGAIAIAALGCTLLTAGTLGAVDDEPCARDPSALRERAWSMATQADLAAHYDAIPHDLGREAFATTRGAIDEWLQRYGDAVATVCSTGPRWEDARAQCLDEGAHELETVVAELATLDEDAAAAAPMLARDLPSPERCIADAQLGPRIEAGAALATKRSISLARRRCQYGLTEDCVAQWDAIERDAIAAGVDACVYEPVVLFERGTSAQHGGGNDDVALLERAKLAAASCDLGEVELDAARVLADRLARRGEIEQARDQLRAAEATFERIGRPPTDGVALLASRSIVELAAGDLERAIEAAEEAIELHDRLAWGAPGERAQLLGMLGAALGERGEHERATKLQLEALELRRVELGHHHPLVAFQLANTAVSLAFSDGVAARKLNAEAIAIFEQHPSGHELSLAICLAHEAETALLADEVEIAKAANERATVLFDRFAHPDDPFAADAVVNRARIHLARGELDDALADARAAHDRLAQSRGPSDSTTLDALGLVGDVLAAQGDAAGARRDRCRAHAAFVAAYGADHPFAAQFADRCKES